MTGSCSGGDLCGEKGCLFLVPVARSLLLLTRSCFIHTVQCLSGEKEVSELCKERKKEEGQHGRRAMTGSCSGVP